MSCIIHCFLSKGCSRISLIWFSVLWLVKGMESLVVVKKLVRPVRKMTVRSRHWTYKLHSFKSFTISLKTLNMLLIKIFLFFALVTCHQKSVKARMHSVEGKFKGTPPRSMYKTMLLVDNYSEQGCNCNDSGCDCPEGLDACCRMGFCCGKDYPICCPHVCCPVDYPVCTDGKRCNPYYW